MKSINFEFLRPKWPELAGLGGFAEAYAHSDPVGAILKLRVFCEQVVEWIHRNRVNNVLQAIIDQNDTLRKIRLGEPVTENDLEDLCSLVLTQEPGLDLHNLMDYFKQAESLDQAIREIIGMDADAVHERFTKFVQAHPNLASHQIKFLDLLQNHIAKFGSIKTDDLYEPPFTTLHSDSLDGLFDESLADELFEIIESFQAGSDSV